MIAVKGAFTRKRSATNQGTAGQAIIGWLARFGLKTRAGQVDVKPSGLTGELGGRARRNVAISGAGVSVTPVNISRRRVASHAPRGYK